MTPAPHDMPVLDAFPVSEYPGHWEGRFPEGVRTYPSAHAIRLAAARIGAAVRYHAAPASTPAPVQAGRLSGGRHPGRQVPTRAPDSARLATPSSHREVDR